MSQITLKTPFKYGETEILAFEIRRPNLSDLRAIDKIDGEASKLAILLTRLASLPSDSTFPITQKLVDMIDLADVQVLAREIQSFLPTSPATGPSE